MQAFSLWARGARARTAPCSLPRGSGECDLELTLGTSRFSPAHPLGPRKVSWKCKVLPDPKGHSPALGLWPRLPRVPRGSPLPIRSQTASSLWHCSVHTKRKRERKQCPAESKLLAAWLTHSPAQKWEAVGGVKGRRSRIREKPERFALSTPRLWTTARPGGSGRREAGRWRALSAVLSSPAEWSPSPSPLEWKWVFTRQIYESHLLTSDLPGLRSGWYSWRGGEEAKISNEGLRKGRNHLPGSVTLSLSDYKFCSCEKHLHFSKRSAPFGVTTKNQRRGVQCTFPTSVRFLYIYLIISWGRGGKDFCNDPGDVNQHLL